VKHGTATPFPTVAGAAIGMALLGWAVQLPASAQSVPSSPRLVLDRYCVTCHNERLKTAGIPYRSSVRGPQDMQVNTDYGGRLVYWNEPDGHQWEILTVSYARPPS